MSFEIKVSKGKGSNVKVRIPKKNYSCELKPDQSINIDDIVYGYWDCDRFYFTSRDLVENDIIITSNDIHIALLSFHSLKCEVRSPRLEIIDQNQIDDLVVKISNYYGSEEKKMVVYGALIVKNKLKVDCSVDINGMVYFGKTGTFKFNSFNVSKLRVNGKLVAEGELKIDKNSTSILHIENNGVIGSKLGVISCFTTDFINEQKGKMVAEQSHFNIDFGGKISNFGSLSSKYFNVRGGIGMVDFQQAGLLRVKEEATLDCGIISTGETLIHHLIFPEKTGSSIKNLKVNQGRTIIDIITGKVDITNVKNGASLKIGEMKQGAEFVRSEGENSELSVNRMKSNKKLYASSHSGGSLEINNGDTPESFMYSNHGEVTACNIKGKTMAFFEGIAKFNASQTEELSLLAKENAQPVIDQSGVKEAYLNNKYSIIAGSNVGTVHNHGQVNIVDSQMNRMNNDNKAEFWGRTSTRNIVDSGESTFRYGDHHVGNFDSWNTQLNVSGRGGGRRAVEGRRALEGGDRREGDEEQEVMLRERDEDEPMDPRIVALLREGRRREGQEVMLRERDENEMMNPEVQALFKDGDARVCIDKMTGYGSIHSDKQIYQQIIPTSFETHGNTGILLNRMPRPTEIPTHSGTFTVKVDMDKDYRNDSNVDYGDAVFVMDMHDRYKWENKNADFIAGGLIVNDSTEFANRGGHIDLEKGIQVTTKNFISEANPKVRDNGCWLRVVFDGHHFSTYCPAKYYSENTQTGITVTDGDINIKSENDIVNRFTSLYTSGCLNAEANGKFENKVGTIIADGAGPSRIKAKEINNICLDATLRQGEVSGSGSSWSFWYRRRERITQSHGSKIVVAGDLKMDGSTRNYGSKIKIGGHFSGNVNNESQFENTATLEAGGGMALEGDNINIKNARIVIRDNDAMIKELKNKIKAIKN